MDEFKQYQSPLTSRYASREMSYLFSPHFKFVCWRRLWVALAKAQKSLGLPITAAQIYSLEAAVENLDRDKAEEFERIFHHDVMAHIHAFGEQCPDAKGIIHLGATSCYVTDNGDLLQMREALRLIRNKIVQVVRHLHAFATEHVSLPCLSYTHFQPAQPTTVGKRACLWIQDLLLDLADITYVEKELHFLGVKGATGTQASFLTLFEGDHAKVKQLENRVAQEMGFTHIFPITGQTYTRKQDIRILNTLSSFAASAHKFATDLRLLAHLKELEEPFGEKQVGSSAMPHKRNPMRSERICGLARFLLSLHENPLYTEATQWLERTLDDSANRRLYIPEAFLCADAILNLLCNISAGLIVHPKMIGKHLDEELPLLATEPILIAAVKKGKDRQKVHERLRHHSKEGHLGDLFKRIAHDTAIGLSEEELQTLTRIEDFIGRSVEQVSEFLSEKVAPLLTAYEEIPLYIPETPI